MRQILPAIIILFSISIGVVRAQDPQFSQFYAAPLYLNPAFAGSTGLARVGANYRNQWPATPASFDTYSAYFDYYFDDYNSGVGLLLLSDKDGLAALKTNSVALEYSYQIRVLDNLVVRPGLQASYTFRSLDFSKLVFGDQIDYSGQINPTTGEAFDSDFRNNFLDLGAGVLAYTKRFWIGFSAHHLLEPNQAFLQDEASNLPRKYSIHGGYKIPLRIRNDHTFQGGLRDVSVTPTAQLKMQGEFSQLDVGTYFNYEPMVFGLWYRGLPFKPVDGFPNNESVVFLLGVSTNGFNIGYSFDYTVSKLGIQTGGAHEISIRYEFFLGNPRKPPKNVRRLPCPKF